MANTMQRTRANLLSQPEFGRAQRLARTAAGVRSARGKTNEMEGDGDPPTSKHCGGQVGGQATLALEVRQS